MGRRVRDRSLESRDGRRKLAARKKPYYSLVSSGLHLGYYKGGRGGRWLGRRYLGNQKYEEQSLGAADDGEKKADGGAIMDFDQAQEKVRSWGTARQKNDIAPTEYTVNQTLNDYFEDRESHGKEMKDWRQRADLHIRPVLGNKKVAELRAPEIRAWHKKLANTPPRLRPSPITGSNYADVDMANPEVKRQRRDTANKILTILKAALNKSWENDIIEHNDAWSKVKPFRGTDSPREAYLSHDECQRLANASAPDFRRLVWAALFTGARYSELARLQVKDYNLDAGTVHIRKSKSGKDRHVILNDEGVKLFEEVTTGRGRDEIMLPREGGGQWEKSHQIRRMNEARAAAKIETPITFHGLRHTYSSWAVMGGMPLMVLARNLGHRDTRMVERHYGHLASEYVMEITKKTSPRFGFVPEKKVARIGTAR